MQSRPITTRVVNSNQSRSWRGVFDITLSDKVCQWLAVGRLFSPGTPVNWTNIADRHYIAEILLKVTLNTITLTPTYMNNKGQFPN